MMDPDELGQILKVFADEAGEILTRMEQNAVSLEADPSDVELLHSLFRGAHTLKGNAASLGLQAMADMSNTLEDVLDQLRSGRAQATSSLTTRLLAAIDALREMLARPELAQGKLGTAHARLRRQLATWIRDAAAAPSEPGERGKAAPQPLGPPDKATPDAPAAATQSEPAARRTLRVDVTTLDVLMNLAAEIATARAHLARACERLGPEGREALELVRDSEQLHVDLHDTVVRARLVPLGPTFRQQARTLRDAADRTGKMARLVLVGEDVMVDTSVIENVREPLVHLVRNALDHGIEAPAERRAAGKDPSGTITLRASRRGGGIVIELSDDGRGLDNSAILARARALGLVAHDAELEPEAVARLLFMPGFTTSASVTDLSGRGVGLDVVRRRVEAVRGSVHVESKPGAGTTITIRVPLTVAIIDGYHVVAGGRRYVIPGDSVLECREWLQATALRGVDRALVELDGHSLACVRLSAVLGSQAPRPSREELVVVDHGGGRAGMVVDAILGSYPTVLRPLGAAFKDLPALTAFTVLGDGEVAPVLDVAGILGSAPETRTEARP